jgi:hypothetical protein
MNKALVLSFVMEEHNETVDTKKTRNIPILRDILESIEDTFSDIPLCETM